MTESQNHGVLFEDEVIKKITGFKKEEYEKFLDKAYTASMDIHKGIHSEENFSIKVKGLKGRINCGDIENFYNHCLHNEFFMVLGLWKQVQNIKRYDQIYEIKFEPKNFHKIWGTIPLQDILDFKKYVTSIPKGPAGQSANRTLWRQKRNAILANSSGHIITIDAKIDSGSQRRVQCTLKLDQLTQLGFPYTVYTTSYRGIPLPYEQESPPRARKKP